MKLGKLACAFLACLAPAAAGAAEIYGGNGIGFSNNTVNPGTGASPTGPWVANIVFSKLDAKKGTSATLKTGDNITHPDQAADAAKNSLTQIVPTLKSMSWCDTDNVKTLMADAGGVDASKCYGWSMHSRWVVLDLNALQKGGMGNVWVSITAKRYDNGDGVATEDDLVPALSVFEGRQDAGIHLHWYPSQLQTSPKFWAWKLAPFNSKASQSNGWATAYLAQGSLDSANVTGKFKLRPGGQNYLSVAVGGDAKDPDNKHDVNFLLEVAVSKKKPASASNSGSNGGAGGIDKCGCEIGVTQWHPSMNHCMAIAQCTPLAGTADQCKTPEMCEKDGGR